MKLGTFSISLVVKNLEASQLFYEKLGFETFGGNADHNYLILKNGDHLVGIFQGMFDDNMRRLTPVRIKTPVKWTHSQICAIYIVTWWPKDWSQHKLVCPKVAVSEALLLWTPTAILY